MIDHAIVENGKMAGVALVPNNHYYGQKAYIQQFTLRYYTDPTSAYKAYKDGTVQGISNVTPDILADVLKESNLAVYSARKPEMSILLLNLNNADVAFFKDVVVRKAILAAINRQAIIDKVLHGQGILANGPIFPESWAYFFTQPVDFDPAQAVFNLKQDGYKLSTDKNSILTKDNQAIKFTLAYPDDPTHQKIAESIQSDLAGINIQVDLQAVAYDKLMSDYLDTRKYQAALVDFNFTNAIDPDPYPFWDQSMATGGQNYSQWNNSMASEYLETARTTVDFNERSRLYRNFQVIFADEQPALPLYYPIYNFAVDNKVQGISVGSFYNTSDRFATVAQWFIQAERGASSSTATPGK
jgi:peptide/nickel transport system substrate-binding protein